LRLVGLCCSRSWNAKRGIKDGFDLSLRTGAPSTVSPRDCAFAGTAGWETTARIRFPRHGADKRGARRQAPPKRPRKFFAIRPGATALAQALHPSLESRGPITSASRGYSATECFFELRRGLRGAGVFRSGTAIFTFSRRVRNHHSKQDARFRGCACHVLSDSRAQPRKTGNGLEARFI
jgi:hypothetical protein